MNKLWNTIKSFFGIKSKKDQNTASTPVVIEETTKVSNSTTVNIVETAPKKKRVVRTTTYKPKTKKK